MELSGDDRRLVWDGAASLRAEDDWIQPYRLPWGERALFHEELMARAGMPSGVRLRFTSDTTSVAGRVVPEAEMRPIDLVVNGEPAGRAEMEGRDAFAFDGLPPGPKAIELWLPTHAPLRLKALGLADGASIEPAAADGRPKWITYGSSITQCRTAAGPTEAWPAIVARQRGLNVRSLGFGGQCHLDLGVALAMRDLPADLLSLCVGINIYGASSFSARSFAPAIIGFVRVLREKHPDVPLVIMSPIFGVHRETEPNAVGFTLPAMREEAARAVEALRHAGDRQVHYIDGLDILGPDQAARLPDDLHPDAEGYRIMGRNLARRFEALGLPR